MATVFDKSHAYVKDLTVEKFRVRKAPASFPTNSISSYAIDITDGHLVDSDTVQTVKNKRLANFSVVDATTGNVLLTSDDLLTFYNNQGNLVDLASEQLVENKNFASFNITDSSGTILASSSQLVDLVNNGVDTTNFVTTDTTQAVTGSKTFSALQLEELSTGVAFDFTNIINHHQWVDLTQNAQHFGERYVEERACIDTFLNKADRALQFSEWMTEYMFHYPHHFLYEATFKQKVRINSNDGKYLSNIFILPYNTSKLLDSIQNFGTVAISHYVEDSVCAFTNVGGPEIQIFYEDGTIWAIGWGSVETWCSSQLMEIWKDSQSDRASNLAYSRKQPVEVNVLEIFNGSTGMLLTVPVKTKTTGGFVLGRTKEGVTSIPFLPLANDGTFPTFNANNGSWWTVTQAYNPGELAALGFIGTFPDPNHAYRIVHSHKRRVGSTDLLEDIDSTIIVHIGTGEIVYTDYATDHILPTQHGVINLHEFQNWYTFTNDIVGNVYYDMEEGQLTIHDLSETATPLTAFIYSRIDSFHRFFYFAYIINGEIRTIWKDLQTGEATHQIELTHFAPIPTLDEVNNLKILAKHATLPIYQYGTSTENTIASGAFRDGTYSTYKVAYDF